MLFTHDAVAALGLQRVSLLLSDRDWIVSNEANNLSQIVTATLRLSAIRISKGVMFRAASMLGMTRSALFAWTQRKSLPLPLVDGAEAQI